jgi:glycosyltransferase involved in cell wall biosynthesis
MGEKGLTVSVAMATFNGASFLEAQLASIVAQSRPPVELVVSDDGSDDGSLEIAERFASQAPFDVRIFRNPTRLGFAANFLRAARLCRGDLIAWSDQDDVWMPGKLARCVEEFEREPAVRLVVHSRLIWTPRQGRSSVRGGVGDRTSPRSRRRAVLTPDSLPLWFSAPGMASVLDRRVIETADSLEVVTPGDFGEWGHDTWTAFLAGATGKLVFLPDVLAKYRDHGANVFGAPETVTTARRVRASMQRERAVFKSELERQATRSFFRATVLDQLAEEIGRGEPSRQAARWRRRGEVHRRRGALYADDRSNTALAVRFARSAARGDYGPQDRGGLGSSSLVRDMYLVVRCLLGVGAT